MASTPFLRDWTDPWRSYVGEFLGTFLFVFISCLVVLMSSIYGSFGVLEEAFAIGFSYAALVFITVGISGGFLNPAVTLGLWLSRKITGSKAFFFVLAQVLAGFLAAEVIYLMFGQTAVRFDFGVPVFGLGISSQTVFILEALMTAGLVLGVFASMVDRNGPVSFGPLVLGLFLTAATIVGQPISGAVFNPARVVGPAVLSRSGSGLLIYVIASLVGSLFAIVYEFIFLQKRRKK